MNIKKSEWTGIIVAFVIIIASLFFINTKFFFAIIGVGIIVGVSPFVISTMLESKINAEKEEMFLEFSRSLVESVKAGTPISKSIINMKGKSYGALTENIEKLANQISLGIPLNSALKIFSKDVNNKTISRALTLIGQAERAGGNIGEILESVTGAVRMSEKLKKERKAVISSLVVQGYIIFLVFLVIILVMEFNILPMVSNISQGGGFSGSDVISGQSISPQELTNSFLYMLLIQGLFSGLAIGKLAEGTIKSGIKHSFALMLISFLISTLANLLWGA